MSQRMTRMQRLLTAYLLYELSKPRVIKQISRHIGGGIGKHGNDMHTTGYTSYSDADAVAAVEGEAAYALLAGRATGQTLIGGTGSGDDLTLQSTTDTTPSGFSGHIILDSNVVIGDGYILDMTGTLNIIDMGYNPIKIGTTTAGGDGIALLVKYLDDDYLRIRDRADVNYLHIKLQDLIAYGALDVTGDATFKGDVLGDTATRLGIDNTTTYFSSGYIEELRVGWLTDWNASNYYIEMDSASGLISVYIAGSKIASFDSGGLQMTGLGDVDVGANGLVTTNLELNQEDANYLRIVTKGTVSKKSLHVLNINADANIFCGSFTGTFTSSNIQTKGATNAAFNFRAWRTGGYDLVAAVKANAGAAGTAYFDIYQGGDITMLDAKNIAVNTTTGTKIGTATNQKLGFFNATPVVQQAFTAVSDPPTQAEVTAIRDALVNLGLMAAA